MILKKKTQKESAHKALEFLDNNKRKVLNNCLRNSRNLSNKHFLMLKMKFIINKSDNLHSFMRMKNLQLCTNHI